MPPTTRKGATAKQADQAAPESTTEPVAIAETGDAEAQTVPESTEPEAEPAPEATADSDGADLVAPAQPEESALSDLQTTEAPCLECFPQGWPELVFAIGCSHGTWTKA